MRVLVAHNRYVSRNPSGENAVVDAEIEALHGAGVDVVPYIRSSDEISTMPLRRKAMVPVSPLYAPQGARDFGQLLDRERPDIVHLHNVYPLISPAVINVAKRRGVPVVQTVHNQRHVCARGTHFRDGHLCYDCVGHPTRWPAVAHACYRDSRTQSIPMAASLAVHRRTWQRVDRFLALTDTLAEHLVAFGISRDRVVVRPNTVEDPGTPVHAPGDALLFVGRLGEEKGIRLLLDAWQRLDPSPRTTLRIAGDGPLADEVQQAAASIPGIIPLGRLTPDDVAAEMEQARAVVVPSTCPEAFPRVVVEAFAHGRPVLATRLGGLPHIVSEDVGWLVDPEPAALAAGLTIAAASTPGWGQAARCRYEQHYAPTIVLAQLLDVYRSLM